MKCPHCGKAIERKRKGAKPWPTPVFVATFKPNNEVTRLSCYRSDEDAIKFSREAMFLRLTGRAERHNLVPPSYPPMPFKWHWEQPAGGAK